LGHPCKFQRVSRLGSVTARHSSSGRQPNFAALSRGRHLYSAGRPSRWALAHISSLFRFLFRLLNIPAECRRFNDSLVRATKSTVSSRRRCQLGISRFKLYFQRQHCLFTCPAGVEFVCLPERQTGRMSV